MVQQLVTDLRRAVSQPRLDAYRPLGGSNLDMVVNYYWNIALSEALYPGLALLEVSLRSSVHEALTVREGTDMWFRNLLEPGQLRDYANACLTLLHRQKGTQPTSRQIVAELTFGFWTTLLSKPYHQTLWAPNHAALVKSVFPNLPPTPSNRHYIHQRYNNLRFLRNRIMHHEPIWDGVKLPQRPRAALSDLHRELRETIGWISSSAQLGFDQVDRFTAVLNDRQQLESDLKSRFSIP
jgi:hypothetical protein